MGREATCKCDWAGARANVKALLETSELILRGEMRRRIPFGELKEVEALTDRLCFKVAGEPVQLLLGKDQALKWATAIKAGPPSLARKLGITGDTTVWMLGSTSDRALNSALAEAARVSAKNPDLIVVHVETPKELEAALKKSATLIAAGTPIWLVYPKGPGRPLNESMIRAAVLPRGLVDTKVASVSPTLTAIRFNLRRAK